MVRDVDVRSFRRQEATDSTRSHSSSRHNQRVVSQCHGGVSDIKCFVGFLNLLNLRLPVWVLGAKCRNFCCFGSRHEVKKIMDSSPAM